MADSITIPFENKGIQTAIEEARAYKKSLEDIGKSANASSAEVSAAFRQIQQQGQSGRNVFLQAFGGEALPEQAKKITESLATAGSSAFSFTTRLAALAGGAGLAVPVIVGLGGALSGVLQRFGAWGAIEGWTDRVWSAVRGTESHAEALVRQSAALSQQQMAMAAAAVSAQKLSDEQQRYKDAGDEWARSVLEGGVGGAWKELQIADETAIRNWSDMQERQASLVVGTDLLQYTQIRATEATERQARAVSLLGEALQEAAKAQGDLSYAVRQGESAADRITRIFRASTLQHERQILENRERRQITRAERQNLIARGYRTNEVDAVLGTGGGSNAAILQLRQAKLEFAEVHRRLLDAGGTFEITARKAHQTTTAYYQSLRTEAQAALDAQHKRNEALAQQHELEKQLLLDMEQKQRDLADVTRELEKQSLLIRQQYADQRAGLGQNALNETLAGNARNQLGLNDVISTDRTAQREALLEQIRGFQELAAANPQDDVLVQQMNSQASALQNVITQYDQLRRAQGEAMDMGLQFSQAFRQNADITQTGAQALANTFSGAFSSMTGALRTHLKAVFEGKEEFGAAMQAMLHETLLNLATESAVQAIFQTALAIAAFATYRPAEGAQHLAAAGIFAATAVLAGGGAALTATQSPSAAQAASSPSKGYANAPASVPPSNSSEERSSLTINLNGTVIGSNDEIGKVIAYHVNRQSRFGNIRIRN